MNNAILAHFAKMYPEAADCTDGLFLELTPEGGMILVLEGIDTWVSDGNVNAHNQITFHLVDDGQPDEAIQLTLIIPLIVMNDHRTRLMGS